MATLEEMLNRTTTQSGHLYSIVERIRPSVETLAAGRERVDPAALMHDAVRASVRASTNHLRHGSALLENLIREESLLVVGAELLFRDGDRDLL
jgi:carbonic anhydrase